jgi:hypothetical protein
VTGTKQEQIDEIMDNFDFNKVAKVMDFLDWKWFLNGYRVPEESEIRKKVRQHLAEAFDCGQGQGRKYTLCTGGFVCSYDPQYSELSLTFELDGWASYPTEESEPF